MINVGGGKKTTLCARMQGYIRLLCNVEKVRTKDLMLRLNVNAGWQFPSFGTPNATPDCEETLRAMELF